MTNSQNVHHLFQGLYLTNPFIFSIRKFVYFWIIFFLFDMQIKTAPAPLIRSIHTLVKNIQTWTTKEASSIPVKITYFGEPPCFFLGQTQRGPIVDFIKGKSQTKQSQKEFFHANGNNLLFCSNFAKLDFSLALA